MADQPPGSELCPECEPPDGDLEVVKRTWGAFQDTGLHEALTARGVDTVVLGGLATNMGVESTGRVADELGYRTVFVADAMAGLHAHAHEFAVDYVFPRIGVVCATEELIAHLAPPPVDPESDLVERCVARIRRQCPEAVAVLFGGSRLRGEAGPFSDVDFDVIVPAGPREDELGWFETVGGRLVRVSVWLRDADRFRAGGMEPQDWAFGLPCVDPYRLCWVADERWRSVVDRPAVPRPAGPPELGHLVGDLAKVGNARVAGDPLALRLAAQDLGRAALSMLVPLNDVAPVTGRYAALRAAAGLAVAPAGFRDDLLTCLGLADEPADVHGVHAAAVRLATGVLDLAAVRADSYAGLVPDDQLAGLRDGTLRRYAGQVVEPGAPVA